VRAEQRHTYPSALSELAIGATVRSAYRLDWRAGCPVPAGTIARLF